MSLRFPIALVLSIACLAISAVVSAEVQTFTATHTYVLGDHDSKDDARQRCLLETKRKILEQAGVYIESASEVKNFDLTKDKITSFAAAVMQVKDTKETVGFENGRMTLTLTTTAQVDLEEVHKQIEAHHVDASVREHMAAQEERLKRLETLLETKLRQQDGQSSQYRPTSPLINISAEDMQWLLTQAGQGNAKAQYTLGSLYYNGLGVTQDYSKAVVWFRMAAQQGLPEAQYYLGWMKAYGIWMSQDYIQAHAWFSIAAARGLYLAVKPRNELEKSMSLFEIVEAQKAARDWTAAHEKPNVVH
jgi:TPR repeat protein